MGLNSRAMGRTGWNSIMNGARAPVRKIEGDLQEQCAAFERVHGAGEGALDMLEHVHNGSEQAEEVRSREQIVHRKVSHQLKILPHSLKPLGELFHICDNVSLFPKMELEEEGWA